MQIGPLSNYEDHGAAGFLEEGSLDAFSQPHFVDDKPMVASLCVQFAAETCTCLCCGRLQFLPARRIWSVLVYGRPQSWIPGHRGRCVSANCKFTRVQARFGFCVQAVSPICEHDQAAWLHLYALANLRSRIMITRTRVEFLCKNGSFSTKVII